MKRKTRPGDERPIGAPVPGGTLRDFRPLEVSRPLRARVKRTGPLGGRRKVNSIGKPVPKKRGR